MENFGDLVSRILNNKDKNFNSVVYQFKKPILDSELNLSQEIQSEKVAEIIRNLTPSGFLNPDLIRTRTANDDELNDAWADTIILKNPHAFVNGWLVKLGGGTNQHIGDEQESIWQKLSGSNDEITITLNKQLENYPYNVSAPDTGTREILIFLEVWQKLITPETNSIPYYGFINSALDNHDNDLIDETIDLETTKRVQIQYNIRAVDGVDFISFRDGLGHPGVYPKVDQDSCIMDSVSQTYYHFIPHSQDTGLYIAGNGSEQSLKDLGTIDGYVYAIPIARVHRRNKTEYSISNLNGSKYSMLDGVSSERPDGLFYDWITDQDIEDLRHQIYLGGLPDFKEILNTNLDLVWKGKANGYLKNNTSQDYVTGNKIISVENIGGTSSTRVPDGTKRVFSEAEEIQKLSYIINSPVLNNRQITFKPKGKTSTQQEYELFDEVNYYMKGPKAYTFTAINIDISSSTISIKNHGFLHNEKVFITLATQTGTLPTGIVANTIYYIYFLNNDSFKLTLAPGDIPIEITTTGTGQFKISTTNLPRVWLYNITSGLYKEITGGTWTGLGIKNMWDYLDTPNKNKVIYKLPDTLPSGVTLADITNNSLLFSFDMVVREGLNGFSENVNSILSILPIEGPNAGIGSLDYCNYNVTSQEIPLTNPNKVGDFTDKAIIYSSNFYDSNSEAKYVGGITILSYYIKSLGKSQEIIPSTMYNKSVIGIHAIYNETDKKYIDKLPIISKMTDGQLKVSGLATSKDQILRFDILLGGVSLEYVAHTKGVHNIYKSYTLVVRSQIGKSYYVRNVKEVDSDNDDINAQCDGVVALMGFYTGSSYIYTCYVDNEIKSLSTVEGFNTSLVKLSFSAASSNSQSTIEIPFIGYYSPTPTSGISVGDNFQVTYEYLPYFGFLKDNLKTENSEQRVKIRYLDNNVYATTAGSGSKIQYVPEDYKGLASRLPLISKFREYNLFGENITTPFSAAISSLKKFPGSTYDNGIYTYSNNTVLKEGMILTFKMDELNKETVRGVLIKDPLVSERGPDLSFPTNHINQWVAVVEGLDDLKDQLFLMVITTICTKYNNIEGKDYIYLKSKDLYKDDSIGKAIEISLNNNLTTLEILNHGNKLIGAVDLFPLKGRPLTYF